MADIGTELKRAREEAGLTREALAQQTRIQQAKIAALEENAFDRLPEGPYLDGLVRAVAAAVGLDAAELWARTRRPATDEPTAPMAAAPATLSGPVEPIEPVEPAEPRLAPVSPAMPVAAAPPMLFGSHTLATADDPTPERFDDVTPERFDYIGARNVAAPPPRFSREGFALAVVALLVAFVLGFFFVRLTRPDGRAVADASAAPPAAVTGAPPARDLETANSSLDDEIPVAVAPRETDPTTKRPAPDAERIRGTGSAADLRADSTAARPQASTPPRDDAAGLTAPPPSPATPTPRAEPAPPATNLTGLWTLATEVEDSSYDSYEGLRLEYRVLLRQQGGRVTGSGEKVGENGQPTGGRARTPIAIHGTVEGDRVMLTFTEEGTRRSSEGRFMLYVADDGVLRGRFSSDAAHSSGLVEARQVETQGRRF